MLQQSLAYGSQRAAGHRAMPRGPGPGSRCRGQRRPRWPLAALATAAWPLLGLADEAPVLREVVVPATGRAAQVERRYPDLQADHALNPYRVAPSSRLVVQTFSAEDIEALKPLDVFDLLNHAVGVLTLYQGRKVPYSVRIRGDLYFAYIVDGVYIPSEAGARVLQNLPVQMIEQVDVVRDATALTLAPMVDFGRPSGAPNDGYIVIRTRRPLGSEATASLRAESYGTLGVHGYAGTAGDGHYLSATASDYRSDGKPGEFMARQSSGGMLRGGLQQGGLRAEFTLFADHTRQQIQVADPYQSTLALQRWELQPIDTGYAALHLAQQWNAEHTSTFTLSSYRLSANLVAGTAVPGVAARRFDNQESIDHADLKHTLRFGDTLLRAGAQHMRWYTPTGASYYEGYPRNERITGWFATVEQGFLSRRLTVDLALRRDQRRVLQGVDNYYAYQLLFQLPQVAERSLPGDRFATLGLAWQPSPDWQLTARAYAARQGAADAVPAVDNKALHPERQHKLEAGLAWRGWPWLRPALTLFQTRIANTKYPAREVRSQNGLTTSLWDEREVLRRGFELMLRGAGAVAGGATDYTLGWTWLAGDTTTEDYGRTAPRHTLAATLRHRRGAWDAAVSLRAVDEFASNWKAIDERFHPIGYYSRLDASLGRSFALGETAAHASLYVRNALNQRYQTQLGYRDIGVLWGLELRVDR